MHGGQQVRQARRERGWSVAYLAWVTGIPKSTLSAFERGECTLSPERLDRLVRVLELGDPEAQEDRSTPRESRRGALAVPFDRLGLVLRLLRGRAGMSQEDLARLLGVSGNTVQHWEAGRHAPARERLVEVVRVLCDAIAGRGTTRPSGQTPGEELSTYAEQLLAIAAELERLANGDGT